MGNPWIKALFADLAAKSDRDSDCDGDSRTARWSPNSRQRTTSSPPKVSKEDYDLAAHARASLHISNNSNGTGYPHPQQKPPLASPSYARPASYGPGPPNNGWQTRPEVQHTIHHQSYDSRPSSSSYVRPSATSSLPPPPLGPRPALFAQEVPYHAQDNISPGSSRRVANGPGGSINPHTQPAFHQAHRPIASSSTLPLNGSRLSPQRPDSHFPISAGISPTRQHTSSNPTRPVFLATPPPRISHRPASDPQPSNAKKTVKSPSVSRTTSDEGATTKPNQCHGTTGAGKRCTRIVKTKDKSVKPAPSVKEAPSAPSANYRMNHNALKQLDRRLSVRKRTRPVNRGSPKRTGRVIEIDSDSEDEDDDFETARISPVKNTSSDDEDLEELPVFCFQHVKQTLEQRGTFINAKSVDFQDWIPAFLPQETQLQLRHEMAKPRPEERRGYIYVHEFPFSIGNTEQTTFIKLGRSIRPVARLSEWRSQCKSRQPVVRDIFPLHATHPLHPDHTAHTIVNAYKASPSHQHGRLLFSDQGARYHQRWERLCLIELAGRSAVQAQKRQDDEIARQACVDCGKIHVELFLVDKGSYERDIRDMVLRWQKFVETIL